MSVVLAIDALEHTLVELFNCKNLKQRFYGRTNISEFSEPRTMVLWSSFMTGKNMEKEILAKGNEEMWNTAIPLQDTFFSEFENPKIIDLPGFNYDKKQHDMERNLLKRFFTTDDEKEMRDIKKEYNDHAFKHHRETKKEFDSALSENHDFVLGYFSVADVIGHLNFGDKIMMEMIYKDLDEIAGTVNDTLIVLSDHGMKQLGAFGDHSSYGFWSTGFKELGNPKITELRATVLEAQDKN